MTAMVLPFPSRGVLRAVAALRRPGSDDALHEATRVLVRALRWGEPVTAGVTTELLTVLHEHLEQALAVELADGLAHLPDAHIGLFGLALLQSRVLDPRRAEIAARLLVGHVHVVEPVVLLRLAEVVDPLVVAPLVVASIHGGFAGGPVVALIFEAWRQLRGCDVRVALRMVEAAVADDARGSSG